MNRDAALPDSSSLVAGFYAQLGPDEMRGLTNTEKDQAAIEFALSLCDTGDRVLDVACGYGRVSVPLCKAGFQVSGVDVTARMIRAAKAYAESEDVAIPFVVGDMLDLPFPANSFDRTLCLWSSFLHLLSRREQVRAVWEMLRVLAPDGLAVVEVTNGESVRIRRHLSESGYGPDGRIIEIPIGGVANTAYIHDKGTLRSLAESCPGHRSKVVFRNIGGRRRLVLWLWK